MRNARIAAALAMFFAACLFGIRSSAQEMVTVHMSPEGYNQVIAQNQIGGTLLQPTSDNAFVVVTGSGPFQPPPQPLCVDELTPQLVAHMQDAANACCCRVFFCIRRSNCAYWLMFIEPNNGCQIAVQYQEAVQAYRF